MPEKVIVPAASQEGLKANIAEHFGRAPYFAVVTLNDAGDVANSEIAPNVGEHAGGKGYTHDHILKLQPNAIIVYGMGPRGLSLFQDAGVAVLRANAKTVSEVIVAYKDDQLQELTEGCQHAHHH